MNTESTRALPASQTYSVREAAAVIGVKPATIYRLVQRRVLVPAKDLRHKRISRRKVHEYIEGETK